VVHGVGAEFAMIGNPVSPGPLPYGYAIRSQHGANLQRA
jgi:hypothetical protein